ncbi:MAG: hypothetical protein R3B72_36165 [Polyangiaceae bacterium]
MTFGAACLVGILAATPSRAAEDDEALGPDPVAAELFRQGRTLVSEGDYAAGCRKLELSMKRYAAPSTLMNIANCKEHDGLVATAWALYERAIVLNRETDGVQRRQELEQVAREAIAALEPRLPRLHIEVTPQVEKLVVTEGGRVLPIHTAVPLDPGRYEIVAEAPKHQRLVRSVELREGETTVVRLKLVPEPAPTPAPEPRASPRDDDEQASRGVPLWAWLSGGAGLAMTAVAIGFAVDARATVRALTDRCGEDRICDEDPSFDPTPDNQRKDRDLGLALGFGIAGLGALTAATVGIVMATLPDEPPQAHLFPSPMVFRGGGGLGLAGSF